MPDCASSARKKRNWKKREKKGKSLPRDEKM